MESSDTHAEDSTEVIAKIKSMNSPSNGLSKMSEEKTVLGNESESEGAKMDIDDEENHNLISDINGVGLKQSKDVEEESNDTRSIDFQLDPDSSVGSSDELKPRSDAEQKPPHDTVKKELDSEAKPNAASTEPVPEEARTMNDETEDFIGFSETMKTEIKPVISKEDISKLIVEYENQLLTEAVNSNYIMEVDEGHSSSETRESSKITEDSRSPKVTQDDMLGVTDSSDDKADDEVESMEVVTNVLSTQMKSKASGRVSGTDSPVTGGRRSGKRSSTFDVSNPAFQKPFEYGWKRELVYRNASGSDPSKIQADVYYYTPKNKKIRSNREVAEHLAGSDLTTDNFTFFKDSLGINDPGKEIIRSAAQRSTIGTEGFLPIKKSPKKKETKEVKLVKEVKTPKEVKPPKETKTTVTPKESKSPKEAKTPKEKTPKSPKDDFKDIISVTGPKAVIGARKGAFPRIKVTALASRSPHKITASKTTKKASGDGDMEMGMLPPSWSPTTNKTPPASTPTSVTPPSVPEAKAETEAAVTPTTTPAVKRKAETDGESNLPKRLKSGEALVERRFMDNFVNKVAEGYNALLQVFQYLKTQELLRAARVCRMWRDLAGHHSLWRTVRLKNSHVDDWQGLMDALTRHGTQHLDLRKILLSNDIPENEQLWRVFGQGIAKVRTLTRIDLCRCPPYVIEDIAMGCPQLLTLNALSIKCQTINLTSVGNLKNLVELRLKSMTGTKLEKSLQPIKELTNLKYLAMTTFKDIGQAGCENFKYLTNLEVLELGECLDLPENFGEEVLMKLTKLERLRLEKGQGKSCHTFRLLAAIKELPKLSQLELINFDVKIGFDAALAQCSNVKRLLLIPTYVTQSATTNYLILEGATKLKGTLLHFVWGVTQELLRVTELFVDQCDSAGSKSPVKSASKKEAKLSESIPILKHGSLERMENLENLSKEELKEGKSQADQVEIQTLHKLQKQLIAALPNTKIKIVKIPFQATWKQTIADPPHH